jgi:8-oxo-dGTP pyrophosphatase MutT (NUDIX family)
MTHNPLSVFNTEADRLSCRVGLVIVSPNGRCLALERASWKTMGPGTWGVPGGKVNPGESPLMAALREAKEETGADIVQATPLFHEERSGLQIITFIGLVAEEFLPDLTLDNEHMDFQWTRPECWPQPAFPGMAAILRDPAAMQKLKACRVPRTPPSPHDSMIPA